MAYQVRDLNAHTDQHRRLAHECVAGAERPRVIVVERGPQGAGFTLNGSCPVVIGNVDRSAPCPLIVMGTSITPRHPHTGPLLVSGSPAEAAGLVPGDVILQIDKRDVTQLSHPQVIDIMKEGQ